MNEALNTVIIVPITSNKRKYPTRIKVVKSNVKGMIAIDQIRTIDKKRITSQLGQVSVKTVVQIKDVISEMLVKLDLPTSNTRSGHNCFHGYLEQ